MTARTGTGSGVRSPEMVRHQRRRELPGVELRTVFDSSRRYWFYSSGFDFLVPVSWRGEVWHQGRTEVLEPGSVLAAHPGDRFASKRVMQPGTWDLLTVDPSALGDDGAAWERIRLRPFSRVSPRLGTLFQAVAESLQSDLLECVQANLRTLLAAITSELIDRDALGADATRPPQSPAPSRPTPPGPPSASPRG